MAKYERSDVQDPLQNDLDGGGNSVTNVAAVEAGSVNTEQAVIGPSSSQNHRRKTTTEAERTVSVPGDYATNQEAVYAVIARWHGHKTEIDIADEPNTDLYIPPHVTSRANDETDSERWSLRLRGDSSNQSSYRLNSLFVDNVQGMGFSVDGIQIQNSNPIDNENAGIGVYGAPGRVLLSNVSFSDSTTANQGVVAYSSNVTLANAELGTGLNDIGSAKHGGTLFGFGLEGTVSDGMRNNGGALAHLQDSPSLTINNTDIISSRGPAISEKETGRFLIAGVEGSRADWFVRKKLTANGPVKLGSADDDVSISSGSIDLTGPFDSPLQRVRAGDGTNLTNVTLDGGQKVVLVFMDSVTVEHNTGNILLNGQSNQTFTANSTLTLVERHDVALAHEVGRMIY